MSAPTCALFGKLPSSREFVRTGCYAEPELAVESAIAHAMESAHGALARPAGRFLFAGRAEPALIGSWVASHDALGRAFPLVVSHRLSHDLVGAALAVLPLHNGELLSASERALAGHAPASAALASTLQSLAPHPSLLLPCLRRARAALARESSRRFQLRVLGAIEGDALAYALATVHRAVALAEPVALELPSAREDVLFAWLELVAAWNAQAHSLLWCPEEDRAWLGLSLDAHGLLQRCWTDEAVNRHCWPLATADLPARREACAYLGAQACALIERDAALAELLASLTLPGEGARGD